MQMWRMIFKLYRQRQSRTLYYMQTETVILKLYFKAQKNKLRLY